MGLFSNSGSLTGPKSLIGSAMIGVTLVALVVTGFDSQSGGTDGNVAARVGTQVISMQSLGQAVEELNRNSGERADEARRKANIQNALNNLIQESLFVEEALRMGWGSTDKEVAEWIKKLPVFQDPKTKQFSADLFQKFVKSGQMSELELFNQGRANISRAKLYTLFELSRPVPESLLKEMHKRNETAFVVDFLEIKPLEANVKALAAEDAKKFAADPANEAKLKDDYEKNKVNFSRKAQIQMQTILVAFDKAQRAQGDALKRTEESANKLASELRTKLQGGEDFAKLAKTTNDDSRALAQGGDLGFIDETGIDPDSWKAANLLTKEAPLSEIIKTPFGFRIVKLIEKRDAVSKTFEEVKNDLALRAVSDTARTKIVGEIEKEVKDALTQKNLQTLDAIAKKYQLSWQKLAQPFKVTVRFIDELGLADPLLPHVFALKNPNDLTPDILDFSGRKVVFKLISRKDPEAPKDEELKLAARMETYKFSQGFMQESQKKLFEIYTKDKDIQRNKTLLQ
jgi:peptidyl-prolyl cis-trans isomerase D